MITKMANRIVEHFDLEEIILFGSHARGGAGPDSDVDLLLVMPVRVSKRKKRVEIGVALHDIPSAKDILVTTREDLEWRKEIVGTIAALEGQVLYARAE
jgi:predicted nucleotidyltransferase